jgi:L-ascorbate metabolism protein UlaG (beta-lactamase superfamily)
MQITWLGHGTFQFQLPSGEVFLMDPFVDGNPKFPAGHQFTRVDAILITHDHFDHIHGAVPLARQLRNSG